MSSVPVHPGMSGYRLIYAVFGDSERIFVRYVPARTGSVAVNWMTRYEAPCSGMSGPVVEEERSVTSRSQVFGLVRILRCALSTSASAAGLRFPSLVSASGHRCPATLVFDT